MNLIERRTALCAAVFWIFVLGERARAADVRPAAGAGNVDRAPGIGGAQKSNSLGAAGALLPFGSVLSLSNPDFQKPGEVPTAPILAGLPWEVPLGLIGAEPISLVVRREPAQLIVREDSGIDNAPSPTPIRFARSGIDKSRTLYRKAMESGVFANSPKGDEDAGIAANSRAAGVPASRSGRTSVRTKSDWQKMALQEAGIDPEKWIPEKGYPRNQEAIERTYDWYARAFRRAAKVHWAGLAKLAGGPVVRGLTGIEEYRKLRIFGERLRAASVVLMGMHREIFLDTSWQILAYIEGGLEEMRRMWVADEISFWNYQAWRAIDSDSPRVNDGGNREFFRREQKLVVASGYQSLQDIPGVPERMSLLAESPVPGGRAFARAVPQGSLLEYSHRWEWIGGDVWNIWVAMSHEEKRRLVDRTLEQLVERRFGDPGLPTRDQWSVWRGIKRAVKPFWTLTRIEVQRLLGARK